MSYISKQEIEDAVKALNRAAVRVRETSSALHNAEDKIKQDEQSLQSAHESKNSARAQVHYARSDTNADERIRNLQSQLESSRVQHEEAAKADAEARKTLDAARATAEKLLSKLDDALSRVTGNIQKLRGARGKSAEYLHANLNAEQQEESKLRQLRERLAEALGSSRDAEQKTSSGGMRGGGGSLEGILSNYGPAMPSGPRIRQVTYVVEQVYYRRASYTIDQQLASDPYSRGHPDNRLPPEVTQPWLRNYPVESNYLQAVGGLRYFL